MAQATQLPDGSVAIVKTPDESAPKTTFWGNAQQYTLIAGVVLAGLFYVFSNPHDLQGAIGILALFGVGGGVAGAQGHKAAADSDHQIVVVPARTLQPAVVEPKP